MLHVDVRLRQVGGSWIAWADTPDGPSLGLGKSRSEAIVDCLEPFEGAIDDLLGTDRDPGTAFSPGPR
jgi:hypothetical protein